ncbi:ABC transporter permease [Clostridium sp.]|uniref:ABC transporter permease n=1 Tax=Clostridium sp. TaxID=1506 RepID=UPI0034649D15
MNFIKRAILSVTKRKVRTIILIVILSVIANLVLTGLSIRSATIKSGELARKKLGGAVSLSVDFEKAMSKSDTKGGMLEITPLTIKDVDKLKDLEHVKAYNYSSSGMALAEGFKPVVKEQDDKKDDKNSSVVSSFSGPQDMAQPDVSLEGNLYSALSPDFTEEKSKLIEGRSLAASDQGKNVAVIEKKLADENKLKLGDKIKVKDLQEKNTLELEVVGIYTAEKIESNPMMDAMTFLSPYNKIYVPISVTAQLNPSSPEETDTIQSAVYYMDDPMNIESFKNDVKASGINLGDYKLDANDSLYKQMMGPIENVGSFSKTIVIIVAIAGIAILSLIIILSLKDRRYEIGVLMSMGESRFKIISQLLVEIMIVACIAFSISTFTGNVVAQKIGTNLLQNEINVTEKQKNSQPSTPGMVTVGPGGTMNENVDAIDKIDVGVNSKDLQKLYLIGFLIVILATTVPTILILRFNPKTILLKNE